MKNEKLLEATMLALSGKLIENRTFDKNKKVTEAVDEKSLEISIDLKNKTYQEWFDEMKNKYGLVYQYTSVLGPKDAPVGKIYVFKDNEDYNYAITNGREFNKLYDSGKLIIKGKKDIAKKTENNKLPNTKI